jgi:hypothetical protein
LVREISSTVRGSKTLFDIVALKTMPQISLSNSGLEYGINIEKVFWRKHGILTEDLLRKSRDEEIIATLLGAFILDRPIAVITSSVLDNLYDENTEDGKIADEILKKCYDNVKTLFIQVFNEIDLIYDETGISISEMLFASDRKKTDIFNLFFKTMLQMHFECKAIGDYQDFADTLMNSKGSILNKFEEKTPPDYITENNTVKLISDIIGSHLVGAESDSPLVKEVILRLNLASIETQYTEYKIGFTFFNTSKRYGYNEGKLNYSNVSQIAKVASAMSNVKKRDSRNPGMIIVGVADKESSYKQWLDHFGMSAYRYNTHRVVGVDAEAKVHYNSVDSMMNAFKDRIDMEPISNALKDDLKNYEIVSIQKRTLIVFTITAESGQLYNGKKYIREGSDIREIRE